MPEDRDHCDDEDSCPDLDNDHDGTPDTQDRCPNEAGPAQQRADVVVRALVARGIDPRRLTTAVGRPTQLSRQHWDAGFVEFRVQRVLTCSAH